MYEHYWQSVNYKLEAQVEEMAGRSIRIVYKIAWPGDLNFGVKI